MDYSSIIFVDTETILNSAITEANQLESQLYRKKNKKGKAELAFESLRDGRLDIGNPNGYTYKIDSLENLHQKQQHYSYYVIAEPILLYPKRGSQYKNLECQIEFTAPRNKSISILNIFPESQWNNVLSWGCDLGVLINGNLEWGIEIEKSELATKKVKSSMGLNIGDKNDLSGFIQVHPFKYDLGRMDIEARHSSSIAMWRFDSKTSIRADKQVSLLTLVKVPNDVKEIQIQVAAQATISYDWLTGQLGHVFHGLSETLQNAISGRAGLPLQKFESWTIKLI